MKFQMPKGDYSFREMAERFRAPGGELVLSVVVRDREGIVFQGEVDAISSFNDAGPFDILPLHTNFISIIHRSLILRPRGSSPRELSLQTGVLKARENKVEVYLGIVH